MLRTLNKKHNSKIKINKIKHIILKDTIKMFNINDSFSASILKEIISIVNILIKY